MINSNTIYNLWYSNLKKINIEIRLKLITEDKIFPYEFYNFNIKRYIELGFNLVAADYIEKSKNIAYYNEVTKYAINNNIDIISFNDEDYPQCLKMIKEPPIVIFVKGRIPQYNGLSIGIVGARKATDYGKTIAYKTAYELAKKGIVIVSGMARGIDTAAHEGAIDANGSTISIWGSGFKNVYPAENRTLMNKIINNGCIITEHLPDMRPLAMNFPYRNRIISAFSKNVLIIEAGERSGSLITANYALEQGKDVFAIPGNITSPMSKGTNALIRDGAKIVTSIDDIIEEYDIDAEAYDFNNLDDNERKVVSLLLNNPLNVEDIIKYSEIGIQSLMPVIGKLECYNIIKKVYGGCYIIK